MPISWSNDISRFLSIYFFPKIFAFISLAQQLYIPHCPFFSDPDYLQCYSLVQIFLICNSTDLFNSNLRFIIALLNYLLSCCQNPTPIVTQIQFRFDNFIGATPLNFGLKIFFYYIYKIGRYIINIYKRGNQSTRFSLRPS